tara:strand:- start:148 stop:573 length:426 start_codon:yes stop_codon:yes gene_type:complete
MSNSISPLKHFNNTISLFINDLKHIFGEDDKEILLIEGAFDLTKINVRLFITPFQKYVASNNDFRDGLISQDVDFFINYDFKKLIPDSKHSLNLLEKFRSAAVLRREDKKTLDAIFNWFKILFYYSYLDEGKDVSELCKTL